MRIRGVSQVQLDIELLEARGRLAVCGATGGLAVSADEVSSARKVLGNAVQW